MEEAFALIRRERGSMPRAINLISGPSRTGDIEQTIVLGEGAKVEGQIEGNRVVIAGRFDGVIFAKGRVEIQPKGVVTGEVHSPCLVIDPGGIFDGRCHMLGSSDAAATVTIPIRAVSQT